MWYDKWRWLFLDLINFQYNVSQRTSLPPLVEIEQSCLRFNPVTRQAEPDWQNNSNTGTQWAEQFVHNHISWCSFLQAKQVKLGIQIKSISVIVLFCWFSLRRTRDKGLKTHIKLWCFKQKKTWCFIIIGNVEHKLWVTVHGNSSDLQKILAGCCQ